MCLFDCLFLSVDSCMSDAQLWMLSLAMEENIRDLWILVPSGKQEIWKGEAVFHPKMYTVKSKSQRTAGFLSR